jgi:hypothetical protein
MHHFSDEMHVSGITESEVGMRVHMRYVEPRDEQLNADRIAPTSERPVVVLDRPSRDLPAQAASAP